MLSKALYQTKGPVAVRYSRGGEGRFREDSGGAPVVRLKSGTDVTIVGYGILINQILDAAERLEADGVSAEVLKLNQVFPLETGLIFTSVRKTKRLVVAEDSIEQGGIGQQVSAALEQAGILPEQLLLKNIGQASAPHGTVSALYARYRLDGESLYLDTLGVCRNEIKKAAGSSAV